VNVSHCQAQVHSSPVWSLLRQSLGAWHVAVDSRCWLSSRCTNMGSIRRDVRTQMGKCRWQIIETFLKRRYRSSFTFSLQSLVY
jgi:hypothetical protein